MPKVIGPLFSLGARKTIGRTLTFQRRPSGHAVFIRTTPYDPKATDQLSHRAIIAEAVTKWQSLTDEQKQQWKDFVK